jgi:hypothetical protein
MPLFVVFAVNESSHVDLTAQKTARISEIRGWTHPLKSPPRSRCGLLSIPGFAWSARRPLSRSDRAKILTKEFSDDVHLKAWAARLLAAADEFQRNKRPDASVALF